jgi:hypothetical protein
MTETAATSQERISELERELAQAVRERDAALIELAHLKADLDPMWQGTEDEIIQRFKELSAGGGSLQDLLADIQAITREELKRHERLAG